MNIGVEIDADAPLGDGEILGPVGVEGVATNGYSAQFGSGFVKRDTESVRPGMSFGMLFGKMHFYLSVLEDTVHLPEEQPSIGIIFWKSKDRLVVEYALKDATIPIGASSLSITSQVPNRLHEAGNGG